VEPLRSARLRLEPLAPCHADALFALYADPEVARFLLTRPAGRVDFERVFAHSLAFGRTHGTWAVFADATLIGRVGFLAFSAAARPELAFLIARAWWGRGLGTEAARTALAWGFARHGWGECVALVRPANRAAQRVVARLGMRREGGLVYAGEPVDVHRVTRAELPAARARAGRGAPA
jgi:ribosomal-protein-alanine N-acetyltransferase